MRKRGTFLALEAAVKIDPRLPQLPSLSELLEHPRVKGLVARVNRSTIAQRAGGFLEEMRSSLAERAGRIEIPSLTHLAERLARRLLGEPAATGPTINATGVVLGDPTLAPPLAEQALHAMVQLGGEYHRRDGEQVQALQRGLCETCGEAAWVASSFDGALTVAIAAVAGNREIVVRGAHDETDPIDWRWLAARAGAALTMQGADGMIGASVAAIVRAPDAADTASPVPLEALVAVKPSDACLIDVAPVAGTLNPHNFGFQSVETINERIAAGADLVVVDGAGLLGGPSCGIVVGARRWIEAISRQPMAAMLAIDPLAAAGLEAVLKLYRADAPTPTIYQIPVWQLLSAPLANLEQRAVRLAALLADAAAVESADARLVESVWRRSGARVWTAKSWVVELRPAGGDVTRLTELLEKGPPPIAARQCDGTLQLDLRSVFPRWDQQLVAAIEAPNVAEGPAEVGPIAK